MAVVGRFGVAAALLLATTLATNEVGTKLLEENAKKEGVVVLPSGLQYRVLRKGEGNFQPTEDSPCECSYKGWIAQKFPDGMTFDGSEGKLIPMLFNPSRVIKGACDRTFPVRVRAPAPNHAVRNSLADAQAGARHCSSWLREISGNSSSHRSSATERKDAIYPPSALAMPWYSASSW